MPRWKDSFVAGPDAFGRTTPPTDPRANLPQLDALLRSATGMDAIAAVGRDPMVRALRTELARLRDELAPHDGQAATEEVAVDVETIVAAARTAVERRRSSLRRVLNATGIVLHTNLGRAPLSEAARAAVLEAAGYTDLEMDLQTGERGARTGYLASLVADLSGAEDAAVVSNGAAALMLALSAVAQGRKVVVSRGELIEIGGSYRLPDVMAAAGARLAEVGTTNRTRIEDYHAAVDDQTGALMKVHRSNFAIVGFTEEVGLDDLVTLGHQVDLPVVHDLGSGLLYDVDEGPLADEPSVAASLRAGADLVVVSGDKLLGGPQAGIVAGRADLVASCRRSPLARAVRIDKLQRAALEATLVSHLREPLPLDVPVMAMLYADPDELAARAHTVADALGPVASAVPVTGAVGGGAAPERELPSWGIALHGDPTELTRRLRAGEPPVLARIDAGRVVLDIRTVPPADDDELIACCRTALAGQ